MYIKDVATVDVWLRVCTGWYGDGLRLGGFMYIKDMAWWRTGGSRRTTRDSQRTRLMLRGGREYRSEAG